MSQNQKKNPGSLTSTQKILNPFWNRNDQPKATLLKPASTKDSQKGTDGQPRAPERRLAFGGHLG